MSDANILFPTIGFALGVAFGYAFRSLLASEDMAELQRTRKQCEEMSESMYRPVFYTTPPFSQRDITGTGYNAYHQST